MSEAVTQRNSNPGTTTANSVHAAAHAAPPRPLSGDAQRVLAQASHVGVVNPQSLAQGVQTAANGSGPRAALAAEVRSQLEPADQARFDDAMAVQSRGGASDAASLRDHTARGAAGTLVAGGHAAAAQGSAQVAQGRATLAQGTRQLIGNPELHKQWVPTQSAITRDGGFNRDVQAMLDRHGIERVNHVAPPPAGSLTRAAAQRAGLTTGQANNINGGLAEQRLEAQARARGHVVQTQLATGTDGREVARVSGRPPAGSRVVDVREHVPHPSGDARLARIVDQESKVGRVTPSKATGQILKDAAQLNANRALRGEGFALENAGTQLAKAGKVLHVAGRIARPLGVALGAFELGKAFHDDGNRIGENTGRTASGLAGGIGGAVAGAAAGAAIGSAVPVVGTVIGGIVGGIIGGMGGEAVGTGLFNAVKGWF